VIVKSVLAHTIGILLIGAIAWLLVAMVDVVEAVLAYRYSIEMADNLAARSVRTQVQVLRRIIVMMIIIVAIAGVLMTFPSIRHIGESLFASAGLAAVVAGLAARTMLSNLLAGVQIALTQPIRLEDAVIVEGEWGWIEEITTTFVRGPDLGPRQTDLADFIFHRETFSKLDAQERRPAGHCVSLCRLLGACRGVASRIVSGIAILPTLGRKNLGSAGNQRNRPYAGIASSYERTQRIESLGSAMFCT